QDGTDIRRHGTFSVGPRDVHKFQPALRMTQLLQHVFCIPKPHIAAGILPCGFDPGSGFFIFHNVLLTFCLLYYMGLGITRKLPNFTPTLLFFTGFSYLTFPDSILKSSLFYYMMDGKETKEAIHETFNESSGFFRRGAGPSAGPGQRHLKKSG